jgi:tetratricopeptide (TPR) repeat protein
MKEKGSYSSLRFELDNAITYGTIKESFRIARNGLRESQARGQVGEVEYFKGQIKMLQNKFASALEHFDAAIKHNPRDGASYNDRALCLVELGLIDEAFHYFDQGIKVESDYATIYHNKGWLLNNIGRHTEAIRYFKKALKLQPHRPVTYDNLADALFNLGDFQGAKKAYQKVLELLKPRQCLDIKKQIIAKLKELETKSYGHPYDRMEE